MMAQAKVRFPLDLTPQESEALQIAAATWGMTRKGLILDALRAYGVNFENPGKQSKKPEKNI